MTTKKTVVAKGILKILTADFMQQLTTIKILHTDDVIKTLVAKAKFGQFFAGTLYDIYGGITAKTSYFDPTSPAREKRPLRVTAPDIFFITTEDNQHLRLMRYKGGTKGPVILIHGLGVSSLIFSIDTIETNLLEYLFEHEYDVWLVDNRASIDLPSANTAFSADEIATYDYPAIIKKVLEVTAVKNVQVIAHCFGATTFCMAMLSGLQGVRSIIFSQIATHAVAPPATEIKAGLYIPTVLKNLGIDSLTAYADTHQNWQENLFDKLLKITHSSEDSCTSAVCKRISFLYGSLYEHGQLNQSTHNSLHEMFGLANIHSFEHLALITRKGHIVTARGEEKYLPNINRLALPVTFIHGGNNRCFLPESTELTFNMLKEKNGASLYKRHVIPQYGHIDCIFGKNASKDVYPYMLDHLERNNI